MIFVFQIRLLLVFVMQEINLPSGINENYFHAEWIFKWKKIKLDACY